MNGINEPNKVGRPTKLTPERKKSILEAIANRIPYEFAAESNGISEETLYAWIRDGIADRDAGIESEVSKFSEELKAVEAKKIKQHLDLINEMPERWQAQAWILERRWWKYFSQNGVLNELYKRLEKLEKGEKYNG